MIFVLISPIGSYASEEGYYELPLDYVHELEAGDEDLVCKYSFTAEKDGVYSVTSKPISGNSYLSKISDNLYTDDFRSNGNVQTYYYKLEKGQEVKLSFRVKANSSAQIFRQTVDLIKGGDEFEFTGEFDKSFIVDANDEDVLRTLGYFKFACDIPKDKSGNNIFIERARMFCSNPIDTTYDYLTREDKSFNEAIRLTQTGPSKEYFIFNIYAYKNNDTSVNIDSIKSKVKYMQLDGFNSDTVKFNLADNPEPIVENTSCFGETDDNGNSYNKYYYKASDYLKSVSIEYNDGVKKEIFSNEKPETEKDPYSKYTDLYPRFTDTQKEAHWAKGTNYFTASFGYLTDKIPVEIIAMGNEQILKLFEDKNFTYSANNRIVKYFGIDAPENGEYTLSVICDTPESGAYNEIYFGTYIARTHYPINENQCEYLINDISLSKGKNTLIFSFMHNGSENGEVKLCLKKLVKISDIKASLNENAPKLVENADKIGGKYVYDISDYAKSLNVTYGKQSVFNYDKEQKTYISKDEKKYSSRTVAITDNQAASRWSVGTNYVTVSIEDSKVQIPIEMVAQSSLDELETDKAYSLNFNSDEKIKCSFKFTPSENGYYSFTSSLDSHGGACRADYDISISGYYDSVENNAPIRLLANMNYTVIITANHNDCSKDTSDINFDTRLNFVTDNPAFLSLNEAYTNNLTDDGTLSQLFIFTPEKTGKYEFEITTKAHDENCEIKTSHKIYLRGKEVSSDLKAANMYIVALSASHNNEICSQAKYKLLKVSIKPVIKSIAAKPALPIKVCKFFKKI